MVCSDTGNTSLTADVDADGRLDEIHDPDRSGRISVLFSRADDRIEVGVGEALGVWQKARGLLTSDLETRGTFGDFDGDGYLDLALFRSQEDIGDSPRSNLLVHEVRYGPLARDLSASRSGTIRVRSRFSSPRRVRPTRSRTGAPSCTCSSLPETADTRSTSAVRRTAA
ncbi:FG-GAP repeat domain-containing protein [Streptomyces sp. NPDC018321]|uniref:FG-GAP repeat domain-containing protein n=1 Tax=unclassified Streptomyces TaxID=2593676 RepID=UPI00379ED05C